MFRRIAIKLFIFQFRIYIYVKTLTKNYLPNSIYEYVFIKPTIQYDGGVNQAHRIDGTIQEVSGEETTAETRGWRGETRDTYESLTSKSETITKRKSLNDIQGMLEVSK